LVQGLNFFCEKVFFAVKYLAQLTNTDRVPWGPHPSMTPKGDPHRPGRCLPCEPCGRLI